MEYEYSIDDGRNMGYLAIRGECGIRELESVFLEVTEDKRFNPDFDILTDLRECTFTFRPNEMSGFFGMFNEGLRSGRGRSALLVSKPHETALANIHRERVSETRTIAVFSTREAAVNWLDQEPSGRHIE